MARRWIVRSVVAFLVLAPLLPGDGLAEVRPLSRPAPFSDLRGRWVKLSAGWFFRPEVDAAWTPFSRGHFRVTPAGPVWVGRSVWETKAAAEGRFTRIAAFGWLWQPLREPSTRSAQALFAVARDRSGARFVAVLPLGPRDDEARLARAEARGATLGELALQNRTVPGAFRRLETTSSPELSTTPLPKRPSARSRLIPPRLVDRSPPAVW